MLFSVLSLVLSAEPARVIAARAAQHDRIAADFSAAHVAYPPDEIYLRAFKDEAVLELWAGNVGAPLRLIRSFSICASSGRLGPKRTEGDGQVPEGLYTLNRFNPWSRFHLSLGVSYPNASDRIRGSRPLGGDVFIHGDCVTIGCLPIRDGPIEELYVVALDARHRPIPVHIFPRRLDDVGFALLEKRWQADAARLQLWRELRPAYLDFERTHRTPHFTIERDGRYHVN